MASVSKYDQPEYTVNQADVARIALEFDRMERHFPMIDHYATMIEPEIAIMSALAESDAKVHAQQALIFALCSPQCNFAINVRAAQRFYAALDTDFERIDDVYVVLTNNAQDSWVTAGMAARALFKSIQTIRDLDPEEMNKASLFALKKAGLLANLGQKTASMACALFDAHADVFTLDVHMLRFFQRLHNGTNATTMRITDVAYRQLETLCVEWCKVHKRSPFVTQWALWSVQIGEFTSHLPIFGFDS